MTNARLTAAVRYSKPSEPYFESRDAEHEEQQPPSGEDGGRLVDSRAGRSEGTTTAEAALAQAAEVQEGAGTYYAQGAIFLSSAPCDDIRVCWGLE